MAAYAIVATGPCVASDGTTQPTGTTLGVMVWDGIAPWTPPANTHAVPYTGQVPYQPPPPFATTIPGLTFWARLTTAEQNAFMTYVGANPTSLSTFVQILTTQITLNSPVTAQWMTFMVSIGAITAPRVAAVLTPRNDGL